MSVLTEGRTALPTGAWALDPVHSTIGFELPYLGGTFRGAFTDVAARLTEESLTGSAKVASVDAKDENLSAHLQSPEFFDVERYPELSFESREIESADETLTVRGEITIRGVTKPVELTGAISDVHADAYGNDRFNVNLSTTVDRTEFGLNWNAPLPGGEPALANDVKLVAELYFVREA
jgi:polyisoprenoid-binding protein YceI